MSQKGQRDSTKGDRTILVSNPQTINNITTYMCFWKNVRFSYTLDCLPYITGFDFDISISNLTSGWNGLKTKAVLTLWIDSILQKSKSQQEWPSNDIDSDMLMYKEKHYILFQKAIETWNHRSLSTVLVISSIASIKHLKRSVCSPKTYIYSKTKWLNSLCYNCCSINAFLSGPCRFLLQHYH